MKKTIQIIAVFLSGFFTYGILDRILLAKAEAKFRIERSRCQTVLLELGKQNGAARSIDRATESADFHFIDWSKLPDSASTLSARRPLAYDRLMGRHEGRGIHILMVDGSVEWDAEAQWLKRFSAEHPHAKLPMPD